jgi:6-phosphofructokinase 1
MDHASVFSLMLEIYLNVWQQVLTEILSCCILIDRFLHLEEENMGTQNGTIRKVAIATGGGDAPGLNAVIRAAVLAGIARGWEMYGIRDGYNGLMMPEQYIDGGLISLTRDKVRGITHLGGTIIGTTNRGNPFHYPVKNADGTYTEIDRSDELVRSFAMHEIDALISVGGDGSMSIANSLAEKGVRVVGVPKTIDNDLDQTVVTFGFDSADVVLIPEIPFDLKKVSEKILERQRSGSNFSIVVVAEGAKPVGGDVSVISKEIGRAERLGGIGEMITEELQVLTGKETRLVVLGHLLRGGSPTANDRLIALRFGAAAVRALDEGHFGVMVALDPPIVKYVPLADATRRMKNVPLDCDTMLTARDLGVCFGD